MTNLFHWFHPRSIILAEGWNASNPQKTAVSGALFQLLQPILYILYNRNRAQGCNATSTFQNVGTGLERLVQAIFRNNPKGLSCSKSLGRGWNGVPFQNQETSS